VFCVDCDVARGAHLETAIGDSSGTLKEPPRRIATKKDASGAALCTACLDARVQRRRAEFLSPRARSAPPEPQPAVSPLSRPTATAFQGGPSVKPLEAPPRRFSGVRLERVRPIAERAARKAHKTAPKRETRGAKGGRSKSRGAIAATVGGRRDREAQLLEWILEHGLDAVQRMIDDLDARIRKLL